MPTGVEYIISIKNKSEATLNKVSKTFIQANENAKKFQQSINQIPKAVTGATKTIDYLNTRLQVLKEKRAFATTFSELKQVNSELRKTEAELRKLENYPPRSFMSRMKELPRLLTGMSWKDIGMMYLGSRAISFGKESTQLFDVQAKAEAQLQAGLQSTGFTSGQSFSKLAKSASELQGKTLFGDEQTMGAQSVLLTFTKVRGEVYDKAIPAIQDLATKMKTDLNSAALQVGMALNEPIEGISRLKRAGVQMSDEQEAAIKRFMDAGQTQEAQYIILNELQRQFGGSAEAAALVGLGPMQQLTNQWNDFKEKIGGFIVNITNKLIPTLKSLVTWLDENRGLLKNIGKAVLVAGAAFLTYRAATWAATLATKVWATAQGMAALASGLLTKGLTGVTVAFRALSTAMKFNIFGLLVAGVVAAISAFKLFKKSADDQTASIKNAKEAATSYYAQERSQLDIIFEKLKRTNPKSKERNELVNQLKEMYPDLNAQILEEITNTNNLAAAYDLILSKILIKAKSTYIEKRLSDKYESMGETETIIRDKLYDEMVMDDYSLADADPLDASQRLNEEMNKLIKGNSKFNSKLRQKHKDIYDIFMQDAAEIAKITGEYMDMQTGNNTGSGLTDYNVEGGGNVAQTALDNITGGGKNIKQVIINLDKLVENVNNNFNPGQNPADASDFMQKMTNALQSIVNDVNYAI